MTPDPTDDELSCFGLSKSDYEDEFIEIYPDVYESFLVFKSMLTQWRVGIGGVIGLDYNCLPWVMKLHNVKKEASALEDIRIMEATALRSFSKK